MRQPYWPALMKIVAKVLRRSRHCGLPIFSEIMFRPRSRLVLPFLVKAHKNILMHLCTGPFSAALDG